MLENLSHGIVDEERSCGECTACCKVPGIEEISKPPYTVCQYCTQDGCSIYENRPPVCKEWFCLWRRLKGLPESARPDKLGVMISFETYEKPQMPLERAYVIFRAVDTQDALDNPMMKNIIATFIEEGSFPIWVGFEGRKKLLYPDAKFADAILNPSTTKHKDLIPIAMEWRKKYGME